MARKNSLTTLAFALALASIGCTERRYHEHRYAGRDTRVDINSASQRELSRLPGISDEDANRIIANRPYPDTEALVRRGVIGPRKFDGIDEYVYAGEGRRGRRSDDRDERYDDHYHQRFYDDRY